MKRKKHFIIEIDEEINQTIDNWFVYKCLMELDFSFKVTVDWKHKWTLWEKHGQWKVGKMWIHQVDS